MTRAGERPTVFVLGAVNLDIVARRDNFTPGTSNPAAISLAAGGVGFNIYRHLRTPAKKLVSLLGDDPWTPFLAQQLSAAGAQVCTCSGRQNNVYLALMQGGELLYGAVDTSLTEEAFDQHFFAEVAPQIAEGDWVVLDLNLPQPTVEQVVAHCRRRGCFLVCEPASADKARRAGPAVRDLFLVTPTTDELAALLGSRPTEGGIHRFMRARRIANIVVTMGAAGLSWHRGDRPEPRVVHLAPPARLRLQDSNGAGDFLAAATVDELVQGRTLDQALRRALVRTHQFLLDRG